jgi:DNA-binding response OmpR family regulator
VLVLEDNATVGGLLAGILREEGYRALRAWDSREAVRIARDRRPDLIMLDLSLPYADGVEALVDLKQHKETRLAPVILLSGNTLTMPNEEREHLTEFIPKPFDIDVMLNAVRKALGEPLQDLPEKNYDLTDSHLNSY